MLLPGADRAIVDAAKVRDYLLSPEHPVGRFKAVFFGALGYTRVYRARFFGHESTPSATLGAIEPKAVVIPCRIGSSAAQRSPIFATCQPITSVV